MFGIANLRIICTDCTEISFSKLRSAGLNYHFPKLSCFTDHYCVGISNKQICSSAYLTFFISCDVSRFFLFHKTSEYDQDIPQSHTADQTMTP